MPTQTTVTEVEESVICPLCKGRDILHKKTSRSNGVCGPGFYSKVLLEYYVCKNCGIMFEKVHNTKEKSLNEDYHCELDISREDILNLQDCLDQIFIHKRMKLDHGCDLFVFTLQSLVKRWEEKIGKKLEDCE